MTDSTPVSRVLTELGVPHRVFRHPAPPKSLEEAAAQRGQRPAQIVRSLVFRVAEDHYVMVLVAGPKQVAWPALRRHLGQSRISMAKPADLPAITGYVMGAVSPFGLARSMPILVDESVLAEEEVSIGSGERGATVILRRDALISALGEVEVGPFTTVS